MTISPEQPKNNQALNETAKIQQPKKTWIEPELSILGVETGNNNEYYELTKATAGETTSVYGS